MVRRIMKKPSDKLDQLVDSVLGPHVPPIASVDPGEVVEVETWSALERVTNPVTGSIGV